MVQATTPTFLLTLPESIDLSRIVRMVFTLAQAHGRTVLNKNIGPSSFNGQTVAVYLTQQETLPFVEDTAQLQLNWTYADGSRACSNIAKVNVSRNLFPEVIS